MVRHRGPVRDWRHQCIRFHAPGATHAPPICIKITGAWCVESAALVAPLTHRAPVTHHRTVVCTCHWCAETEFPAGINLVHTVAPDWCQVESLIGLVLIKIPAVSALGCASKKSYDDIRLWQVLRRPGLGEKKMSSTMKNVVFKSVLV